MAKDYDHLFKLLIIGDSGKHDKWFKKYRFSARYAHTHPEYGKCHALHTKKRPFIELKSPGTAFMADWLDW